MATEWAANGFRRLSHIVWPPGQFPGGPGYAWRANGPGDATPAGHLKPHGGPGSPLGPPLAPYGGPRGSPWEARGVSPPKRPWQTHGSPGSTPDRPNLRLPNPVLPSVSECVTPSSPWLDSCPTPVSPALNFPSVPPPTLLPNPRQETSPSTSPREQQQQGSGDYVWRDFLDFSTVHGILDVSRPGYGREWKAAWIVVMLLFAGMTVYSVKQVIEEYVNNPTVQNYKVTPQRAFELPDVTVCTHQRLNYDILERMGMSKSLLQALLNTLDYSDTTTMFTGDYAKGPPIEMRKEYEQFQLRHGNITFEQILRQAGLRCEQMIKACSWSHIAPCCQLAVPFLDRVYGQCYRFNRTANMMSSNGRSQGFPGPGAGIQMALYSQSRGGEAKKKQGDNQVTKNQAYRGVLVDFLYPDEPMGFSYSQIPSGVSATVHLTLQISTRLNVFGREPSCQHSTTADSPAQLDAQGRFSVDTLTRSANGCYYVMWSKSNVDHCNCTRVPNLIESSLCEPFDQCPFENQMAILNQTSLLQEKNCLPQCTQRSYSSSITYSQFDHQVYNEATNDSYGLDDHVTLLDVYHPKMEYLRVDELEVYSIITLVSNIGGAAGLWLGASLMSILQVIFYCTKWVSIKRRGGDPSIGQP